MQCSISDCRLHATHTAATARLTSNALPRPFAGHCGDKHSRKTSLVYSLLLMAVPTTLMGCLPTFQHISWAAPVLLILLRLGQGLAIGGENGTALV
jgi:MFS family permease